MNCATVCHVDKWDFLKPDESVFSEGILNGLTATFYIEDTIESTNSETENEVEESTPTSIYGLPFRVCLQTYSRAESIGG